MEVGEDEIILFWRFTRSLCSTEHREYLCTVWRGEVLEPQSLMKPSLAPPVHVKKARKTGSHGDCDYAFLCYRDHSDLPPLLWPGCWQSWPKDLAWHQEGECSSSWFSLLMSMSCPALARLPGTVCDWHSLPFCV